MSADPATTVPSAVAENVSSSIRAGSDEHGSAASLTPRLPDDLFFLSPPPGYNDITGTTLAGDNLPVDWQGFHRPANPVLPPQGSAADAATIIGVPPPTTSAASESNTVAAALDAERGPIAAAVAIDAAAFPALAINMDATFSGKLTFGRDRRHQHESLYRPVATVPAPPTYVHNLTYPSATAFSSSSASGLGPTASRLLRGVSASVESHPCGAVHPHLPTTAAATASPSPPNPRPGSVDGDGTDRFLPARGNGPELVVSPVAVRTSPLREAGNQPPIIIGAADQVGSPTLRRERLRRRPLAPSHAVEPVAGASTTEGASELKASTVIPEPPASTASRILGTLRSLCDSLLGFDRMRRGELFSNILCIIYLSILPLFCFGFAVGGTRMHALLTHYSTYGADAFNGGVITLDDTTTLALPTMGETAAVCIVAVVNVVSSALNVGVGLWCRIRRVYPRRVMLMHLWASSIATWILIEVSPAFPGDSFSAILALVAVAADRSSLSQLLAVLNVLASVLYRVNARFDSALRPAFVRRKFFLLTNSDRIVYFLEDMSLVLFGAAVIASCVSYMARQYLNAHGVAVLARRVAAFAATYDTDAFRAELDCYAAGQQCEAQLLENHRLLLAHLERFGAHLPHYIPEHRKSRVSALASSGGTLSAATMDTNPLGRFHEISPVRGWTLGPLDGNEREAAYAPHAGDGNPTPGVPIDADAIEAACAYGVPLAEWCELQKSSRSMSCLRGSCEPGSCVCALPKKRKTVTFRLDVTTTAPPPDGPRRTIKRRSHDVVADPPHRLLLTPMATASRSPPTAAADCAVRRGSATLSTSDFNAPLLTPVGLNRNAGRHVTATRINLIGTPLVLASDAPGSEATAAERVALQWFDEYSGTFMARLIAAVEAAQGALVSATGDEIYVSWNAAIAIANPEAHAARFMVYAAHTLVPELNAAVVARAQRDLLRAANHQERPANHNSGVAAAAARALACGTTVVPVAGGPTSDRTRPPLPVTYTPHLSESGAPSPISSALHPPPYRLGASGTFKLNAVCSLDSAATFGAAATKGSAAGDGSDLPIELPYFSFSSVTGRAHCFYAGGAKQVFATVSLGGCRLRCHGVSAFADRFGGFSRTLAAREVDALRSPAGMVVNAVTSEGSTCARPAAIGRPPVMVVDAATHAAIGPNYFTLPVGVVPFQCGGGDQTAGSPTAASSSGPHSPTGPSRFRPTGNVFGVGARNTQHVYTPDGPWSQLVLHELVEPLDVPASPMGHPINNISPVRDASVATPEICASSQFSTAATGRLPDACLERGLAAPSDAVKRDVMASQVPLQLVAPRVAVLTPSGSRSLGCEPAAAGGAPSWRGGGGEELQLSANHHGGQYEVLLRALRIASFHAANGRPLEAFRQLQRCHEVEAVPLEFRAFHFFLSTLQQDLDKPHCVGSC